MLKKYCLHFLTYFVFEGKIKKLPKKKKQGSILPQDKPTQELEAEAVDVEETPKDDTVPEEEAEKVRVKVVLFTILT